MICYYLYFSDDYASKIIQSYYSAVTYIDDLVGQLLQKLEAKGLSNNTMIVLVGDHGKLMADIMFLVM